MTRVASFSQNQSLISGIARNQSDLFNAQQQVNTGKKSNDYKGIAQDASTLVSARSLQSRAETFLRTGSRVQQTLSTNDIQLTAIVDTARDLRQSVVEALGNNDGSGLPQILEQSLNLIGSALNTQVGGSYVFGGSQIDREPFAPTTLADLVALPAAADAFQNDSLRAAARVSDSLEVEYGVVADDVAEPLIGWIRDLAVFDAGPNGAIGGTLSPAQRTQLETTLSTLDAAIAQVQSRQVSNGLKQQQLDQVSDQLQSRADFLETFVADIEDVNIAEAITRLQNDQTALEASYRAFSSISDLSLVRFL